MNDKPRKSVAEELLERFPKKKQDEIRAEAKKELEEIKVGHANFFKRMDKK